MQNAGQASPIVRVAVEPRRPEEMRQLEEGLRLLNIADPFVEVALQDNGEHVVGAAGEKHICLLHVHSQLRALRQGSTHARGLAHEVLDLCLFMCSCATVG